MSANAKTWFHQEPKHQPVMPKNYIRPEKWPTFGLLLFSRRPQREQRLGQDVAAMLNAEGYRTSGHWRRQLFGPGTTRSLLQNRFYLGEVRNASLTTTTLIRIKASNGILLFHK